MKRDVFGGKWEGSLRRNKWKIEERGIRGLGVVFRRRRVGLIRKIR